MYKNWRKLLGTFFIAIPLLLLVGCNKHANTFQGYIAGIYTYISSPSAGILDKLFVVRGQQVKKGQKLFVLDAEPEASQLKAAKKNLKSVQENLANLEKGQRQTVLAALIAQKAQVISSLRLAHKTYYRYKTLLKQHLIDKESFDKAESNYKFYKEKLREIKANIGEAKLGARKNLVAAQRAQVEAARAKVKEADWALEQKSRSAPVTAQVFDRLFSVGEMVPAGSPVVMLLAPKDVKAIFFVPERELSKIRLGQKISLSCDGCAQTYAAKIAFISPQAEYTPPVIFSETSRNKLVYRVEALMDVATSVKMHPGQPVTVRVLNSAE